MFEFLQFTEGTTTTFFSTGAQCVAGVAGLSAAVAMFHYQNLTQRIRDKATQLFEKYDPMGAGLKKDWAEKYSRCRSLEESVDFWKTYFTKEAKDSHQIFEFNDLYALIHQTKSFRRAVIRVSFYGFLILLPLGILGTMEPAVVLFRTIGHTLPHLIYGALLFSYFMMNFSLAKKAFVVPWAKK